MTVKEEHCLGEYINRRLGAEYRRRQEARMKAELGQEREVLSEFPSSRTG
jgi:hypothetical protein